MRTAVIILAIVAFAAVANSQAPKAAIPAPATKAATPAANNTDYCHHSCYKGVDCKASLKAKRQLLDESLVPYKIVKEACNVLGCDSLVRYSFTSQDLWAKYQWMEKNNATLFADYTKAGLKSGTPTGLPKNGTCATLVSF